VVQSLEELSLMKEGSQQHTQWQAPSLHPPASTGMAQQLGSAASGWDAGRQQAGGWQAPASGMQASSQLVPAALQQARTGQSSSAGAPAKASGSRSGAGFPW
jgi:hypothetical protein